MKHTITWGRPQEAKCTATGRMYFTFRGTRLYAEDFVRFDSAWTRFTPTCSNRTVTAPEDVVYKGYKPVASMYLNMCSCYYLIPISQDDMNFIVCLCTWSDL